MPSSKKEETFIPAKSKKYKRGDILQAHLGFNIGCEEGGLHYVVAINNDIPASSDIITVIPLTSKKKLQAILICNWFGRYNIFSVEGKVW